MAHLVVFEMSGPLSLGPLDVVVYFGLKLRVVVVPFPIARCIFLILPLFSSHLRPRVLPLSCTV